MSKTTRDLKNGLKKLKNRGSMTVTEIDLLNEVINRLDEYEKLISKEDKLRSGAIIVDMLLRFLTNPTFTEYASHVIDKFL